MSSASPTSQPDRRAAPTVIVGVGAGIAAFKVAHLVRGLRKHGFDVFVIPTEHSLEFVGLQTWQELSENPVSTGVFHGTQAPGHIELARRADLFIVAPCTADLGARLRGGMGNDLLSATFLAFSGPKLVVPAMHTGMWLNPATVENFAVLAQRGVRVLAPEEGSLSSGDTGVGRMPEPDTILTAALELLSQEDADLPDLTGRRVLVSAGGTIEKIDPVRYLANHSSGRQGVALAVAAAAAGAQVTLLAARCDIPMPRDPRIAVVQTLTAREMAREVDERLPDTDILIMAAAVADYRPAEVAEAKLKKATWGEAPSIRLTPNPDILREAAHSPHRPDIVVGFAAETGDPESVRMLGRQKAQHKGADFIAINRVGDGLGFGAATNELWVVDGEGTLVRHLSGQKDHLARELLKAVVRGAR